MPIDLHLDILDLHLLQIELHFLAVLYTHTSARLSTTALSFQTLYKHTELQSQRGRLQRLALPKHLDVNGHG